MIILTGANGFIGTNVLFELNKRKIYDIIIVDDKKSINMNNNLPNRLLKFSGTSCKSHKHLLPKIIGIIKVASS